MELEKWKEIDKTRKAALEVLLHNAHGPYKGLPRTAGWGYPEPYTRDLMISILGISVSGDRKLIESIRNVLETLAKNQTRHGHIPSLVHDKNNRGASDTTPLFLLAVGIFRKISGEIDFLKDEVNKSLHWMKYQCPLDLYLVAQLPTSDWRDEQWVIGYGLYVNTIVYSYLCLLGYHERAGKMLNEMRKFITPPSSKPSKVSEGFAIREKPYFAFWTYKLYQSERFDLLGNSLAILSGIASHAKAVKIISWIEEQCSFMKKEGDLAIDLPPNFFPFIKPGDSEWRMRYEIYNKPGDYHNGGIWPFISGFYVAALVAAKKQKLAEKKLWVLTQIIKTAHSNELNYGFNEWLKAQNGHAMGQDWQTWSAALYLYAVKCVEEKRTPFFDEIRI